MAVLTYGELPFGLRNAAIYKMTTDGTGATPPVYASKVDVPRIQNLELQEEEDSAQLDAADVTVATHTFGLRLTGSISAGGINLDTLAVLTGGTVSTTGMTPSRVTTFARRGTDSKPYFKVTGQSYGDDAGDLYMTAYKVKAVSGPTYAFNQGEFAVTQCDLQGVFTGETTSKLYDLVAHETVTAIS